MKLGSILLSTGLVLTLLLPPGVSMATSELEENVCNREQFAGCLNGVGSSVTNGAGLRMNNAGYGDIARERSGKDGAEGHAAAFAPDAGLAAGDDMAGSVFGMWGSYSYSDFDSDFVFQGNSLAYDASSHNVLFGFDRLFHNSFLLGLALGYQAGDADTAFNGGGQDNDGYTIAPYAAFLLNDILSLDIAAGYSWNEYDQDRISPADGTNIEASFDSERWFVATNLNALLLTGNWVFGARVGYMHTDEEQDAYLETGSAASAAAGRLRTVTQRDIDLSQLSAGADIGYNFGNFEPFFMATYRNDLGRSDGNGAGGLPGNFTAVQPEDDDEVQLNFGVRYYTNWGVSTTLEYQRIEGRSFFDSDTFMLTVRAAL